ncbi:chloride channel [Tricharina praecox]|uniref:chloride channel n=1 Tax=Tricharina praecox TaxID=43433 RepID=UPI00221F356F|nr:chloride channel [Tricharina praecox]KAI5848225.1 chloride channel [Tricharina praecox]
MDDGGGSALSRETSPPDVHAGRHHRRRPSGLSQKSYRSQNSQHDPDENTGLLSASDVINRRSYSSVPGTPRPRLSRHQSSNLGPMAARASRAPSFTQRLTKALSSYDLKNKRDEPYLEDRVWYDQFTSTDWINDAIKDAYRVKALRARQDIRGKLWAWFDGAQGWILVAIIGFLTACVAFFVDVTENVLFDYKDGYCTNAWYYSKRKCCLSEDSNEFCPMWNHWSKLIAGSETPVEWIDFAVYVFLTVFLATLASLLTMTTRTVLPGALQIHTVDEDLSQINAPPNSSDSSTVREPVMSEPISYYSAAGSGVAEVKVILSGFVLHGYLGLKTLVVKTFALILSVSSGMSLGKEGPFVHIATCVGNIACRLFSKYNHNDAKRREILSASAASGVAVAFGAPIGGVLFSLEEVSYYFPAKTLFRTFFCCIVAALSLKFLNPYGTSKIVLFQVRYVTDWHFFELFVFVFLGVCGGVYGAMFIKASKYWATTFRKNKLVKSHPVWELAFVALITGLLSYWNRYVRLAVSELLFELASPCSANPSENSGLCPKPDEIPGTIIYLLIALALKSFLTVITFGTKVPAGVYVPTMVIGGIMGHAVGLTVEYAYYIFPDSAIFASCGVDTPSKCVVPGVYAMVCAGAVMCGVTRLSVTLAVILFELTGSLDHVLPFSLAVLVSKWTADAIEPLSIYDLLTDLNSYPYLDTKSKPVFSSHLADICPRLKMDRVIDISESSLIIASELRAKLKLLQSAGQLDGGLPILRDGVLVGLIPAPDLEYGLDRLSEEEDEFCLMAPRDDYLSSDEDGSVKDPTDFTPYIDPAPMALERNSPMDLVYECFAKLGLRYLCVLRDGKFAGVVHKKAFVKYLKEVHEGRAT